VKHRRCKELVLGRDVVLPDSAEVIGGTIVLGDGVRIGEHVRIEVTERLVLGKGSVLGDHTVLRGRDVELGREFYTNHHAEIGGGSCFEGTSRLRMGCWGHLGSYSMVNTAMAVETGDEVGLGRFSNIYTHGAYLSEIDGFPVSFAPVTLGSRVWIPGGTVNPGVTIGDDVVVAVGSVVTRDLPSGCLAGGTPARLLRENVYPQPLPPEAVLDRVERIFKTFSAAYTVGDPSRPAVRVEGAEFDFGARQVSGPVSKASEHARNLLRRHGIRFRVEADSGQYEPWRDG